MKFPLCSYPKELQDKWREERQKRRGMEQQKLIKFSAADTLQNLNTQLMNQCDALSKQSSAIFTETIALLKDLKSGDVALEALSVNDSGWTVIPPASEEEPVTRAEKRRAARNGKKVEEVAVEA